MQSNAKQIYTIGFCVYQRNYLIINKAVISFRYAVFIWGAENTGITAKQMS